MIFNMVGGAGGGKDGAATLTVTAPTNTNVTVSKDTKSYTKNSGASGVVVFQGLTTGQWAVSISNEQQTQTRTINITTTYSMVIAFFAATINITYPAGSTCTVSKGATVFDAPDTSGTWDCVVPSTGTWTVTCTDGELISSQNVSITADGQTESVTLAYFTATINITYPATSTCTVTNSSGATIVTDTNTTTSTKTFVATVHATGAYSIVATATDGSGKTKTTTVPITTDGQSESVTLSYSLIVFNNGEQDTEVTGGITKDGYTLSGYNSTVNSQVAIGETIVLKGVAPGGATSTDKNGLVGTANIIDMSPYTTLRVKGTVTGWAPGAAVYMGVNKSKTVTRKPLAYISITANETNFERTLSLPSNQTELYVFALAARADGTTEKYTTTLTLTHISLE